MDLPESLGMIEGSTGGEYGGTEPSVAGEGGNNINNNNPRSSSSEQQQQQQQQPTAGGARTIEFRHEVSNLLRFLRRHERHRRPAGNGTVGGHHQDHEDQLHQRSVVPGDEEQLHRSGVAIAPSDDDLMRRV